MSIATMNMPRLGETMEQGVIVGWLIEVGQRFERGDAILEVETDKTVVEYPALGAGVLAEILAEDGDTVGVGSPIARIDLGDASDWTLEDQDAVKDTEPASIKPRSDPAISPSAKGTRPRATPVARRLARQAGVEIGALTGTGRRGRIEARDVTETDNNVHFSHDIAFVKTGAGRGAPFLLIHGFAGDHTTYSVLANGLARRGHSVICCDLPGHGATMIEASTPADLSENLVQFAKSQFGQSPIHLVAHSLGTVPALALAQTIELASLTLIAPAGLGQTGNPDFLTGMASPKSAKDVQNLIGLLTEKPSGLSSVAIEEIYLLLSKGRLVDLAKNLSAEAIDERAKLADVAKKIPTRILTGQHDRILMPVDNFALPPEVGIHSFAGSGHMPHWENPQSVLSILLAV